jgi:cytochrome P450
MTTEKGAKLSHHFDRWLECGALMANVKSLLGEWAFVLIGNVVKDQAEAHRQLYGILDENIERIKRGETVASILDDALPVSEKEGVRLEVFRNAAMNLLFAGHDTTAALLGFITYELSKRPDLQKAIRDEVEEANGPGELNNLEVLEKCKVLNAVIKEALRKYPSAPYGAMRYVPGHVQQSTAPVLTFGFRTAFEDFTVEYTDVITKKTKRVMFEKGDQIFTGFGAMQNYAPFWSMDPSKFSPERFYDDPNGGSLVRIGVEGGYRSFRSDFYRFLPGRSLLLRALRKRRPPLRRRTSRTRRRPSRNGLNPP